MGSMEVPSAGTIKTSVGDHVFDHFAAQNEEWILRIQKLGEEEAELQKGNLDFASGSECDANNLVTAKKGRLSLMRTILHTARLANLQCASEVYRESGEEISTANLDQLILRVQHEIDTDGNHHESMRRNILGGLNLDSSSGGDTGGLTSPLAATENSKSKPKVVLHDGDLCTNMELDAFFNDYPECSRTLNEGLGYYSDSDNSSGSDSDEEEQASSRHRKKRASPLNEIASMTVDLVAAASEPLETQPEEQSQVLPQERASKDHHRGEESAHQCQKVQPDLSNNNRANTVASTNTKNPYTNRKANHISSTSSVSRDNDKNYMVDLSSSTAQHTSNSTNIGSSSSSMDRQLSSAEGAQRTNSFKNPLVSQRLSSNPFLSDKNSSNNGCDRNNNQQIPSRQIDPNPYRRSSSSQNRSLVSSQPLNQSYVDNQPNSNSNSNDAWRDHRNQTNPFQTAREVALAEQNHPHRDPFRNRGGSEGPSRPQHSNPRQPQHPQQNSYHNPYGYEFQSNRSHSEPSDNRNEGDATSGGPFIPDSLKRKFQRPKRGLGSLSQGGKNKVNNNRSHLRSSASKPLNSSNNNSGNSQRPSNPGAGGQISDSQKNGESKDEKYDELPEELQHLDKELVKKIQNEIMESGDVITFDDIAGLDDAKATVQEVVCWPMKRPDLFTGLRRAPNGLLLYGPPGTGKTLIGKAIAHESGATFFSISSSSLTSKWIGEGEKLVKTLFAVAAYNEPAVIFLDEIDSLLTQRKSTENEASRRIKTEFLVQLDGTGTTGQGRVLIIGATNRPQELDEAARRRFTKRLYIPLPVEADRRVLLKVLLKTNRHKLTETDIDALARDTEGFSGADLKSLCTDAAMGPIRQLGSKAMEISVENVPPISYKHFKKSLRGTKPSVAPGDLKQYVEWDKTYGTKRYEEDEDEDD